MKSHMRLGLFIYGALLKLYPPQFRKEFEEEMLNAFVQRLADASERGQLFTLFMCLREFWALPANLVRQHASAIKTRLTAHPIRIDELPDQDGVPGSGQTDTTHMWRVALAGMLLFLPIGLYLILSEIPHGWSAPAWLSSVRGIVFLSLLVLPAIGFGIGWVKAFPRWSYPYVVFSLIFSLFMMNAATPGLRLFGYTIGSGD